MNKTISTSTGKHGKKYSYVLVSPTVKWQTRFPKDRTFICSGSDSASVVKAVSDADKKAVWISESAKRTESLMKTLAKFYGAKHGKRGLGKLLTLEAPKSESLQLLGGWFDCLFGASPTYRFLSGEELLEVFSLPESERRDLIIGGASHAGARFITLLRGDFSTVLAPFSMFRPSGTSKPNFKDFSIGDYGNTIRFGEYESTADVVLWELDADYRKRMRKKETAVAKGLGASLRRLRIQRGLSQSAFYPVARKTIARLENGEIQQPHAITLDLIAKRLGVKRDEIESY